MIQLTHPGQAGTMESGDILVVVAPAAVGEGIVIDLTSPVVKQFGRQIKQVIIETLTTAGIREALVHANDKGALDCTIRARVTTAMERALAKGEN